MTIEDRKLATMYFDRFGDKKPSELDFKRVYICPSCNGKGKMHQRTEDGRGEYNYICPTCRGVGYTEKELKPKMVQMGWE